MSKPAASRCRTQDGVMLAYDTCGDAGPVIVLIHGALACLEKNVQLTDFITDGADVGLIYVAGWLMIRMA